MKVIKKSQEFTIIQKRSGRYGVLGPSKDWINGEEKIKILLEEGLIKTAMPKPKEEEQPQETQTPAEGNAEGNAEAKNQEASG